jgi:hypothetical protein
MHLLSQIIYCSKTLYMFRTVLPSIIRSSKLRIQQQCMSNSCCYRGWAGSPQMIYSCKTPYMFRAVFLFIIRSSKLCIQQRYMSNSWCHVLLPWIRWNSSMVAARSSIGWQYLKLYVQLCALDDGRRNCLKHNFFYYYQLDTQISCSFTQITLN